ncbi:MAG: DNA repair protein RecO [Actinomycetaceae bacterium]|nr:DNA repair protein RecO [Actinomycetaceae bacterium]
MKTYRDEAIVLRSYDIGEADRVITLLTRQYGKVRGVAKGVRKTKSRFGGRLEPFSMVDVQLYRGKTLDTITQVEILNQYGRTIVRSYDAYTAASAIVELADRLHPEESEADAEQFALLHGALHAIATDAHAPELVLNSYMLRAMAFAGWALSVFECARCGENGPHHALSIHVGGAVCENCRPPGATIPTVETWQLLGALLAGDWTIADVSLPPARKASGAIIAAYVQWHLERQVKSLRLIRPE